MANFIGIRVGDSLVGVPAEGETKIKKQRCSFDECKKVLDVVEKTILCRCEQLFCKKHRDIVAHGCQLPSGHRIGKVRFVEPRDGCGSAF